MSVMCINCDWGGHEEELMLVEFGAKDENETPTATELVGTPCTRISPEPEEIDFLKGCPNCLTDSYLTNKN